MVAPCSRPPARPRHARTNTASGRSRRPTSAPFRPHYRPGNMWCRSRELRPRRGWCCVEQRFSGRTGAPRPPDPALELKSPWSWYAAHRAGPSGSRCPLGIALRRAALCLVRAHHVLGGACEPAVPKVREQRVSPIRLVGPTDTKTPGPWRWWSAPHQGTSARYCAL